MWPIFQNFVGVFLNETLDSPEVVGWKMHETAAVGYDDTSIVGEVRVSIVVFFKWISDLWILLVIQRLVWFITWSQPSKYAFCGTASIRKG